MPLLRLYCDSNKITFWCTVVEPKFTSWVGSNQERLRHKTITSHSRQDNLIRSQVYDWYMRHNITPPCATILNMSWHFNSSFLVGLSWYFPFCFVAHAIYEPTTVHSVHSFQKLQIEQTQRRCDVAENLSYYNKAIFSSWVVILRDCAIRNIWNYGIYAELFWFKESC